MRGKYLPLGLAIIRIMVDDQDPEKGEIRPGQRPKELTEKDEIQALDVGDHAHQGSEHSRGRSSEDIIEPAPVDEMQHASRNKSQTSSTRSRPMSVIPRSKRRGLLGRFTIIPEVEQPYNYKNSIKWAITALVALAAAAAPVGSAIFYRALTLFFLYDGWSLYQQFHTGNDMQEFRGVNSPCAPYQLEQEQSSYGTLY